MKDRRDATRIQKVDPFHSIVPYMMPKRTEAEVSMRETFDVTALRAYMKRRNGEEGLNLKLFHAICTAVAKTIYHRPKLNIFISGRRFWQRRDITLSFVAKQTFRDDAEETLMCMKVRPDMTLDAVSRLILGDVDRARKDGTNDLDKTMKFVGSLPRFLMNLIFAVVRRLEYHGIMPAFLTAGDPNYSTVLLANLGSIGCGAPYHHLSNYGTCSVMITIGTMRQETRRLEDGSEETRDVVDMTVTLDERIADGFYFARSLRMIRYLLEHPETLAEAISAPVAVPV